MSNKFHISLCRKKNNQFHALRIRSSSLDFLTIHGIFSRKITTRSNWTAKNFYYNKNIIFVSFFFLISNLSILICQSVRTCFLIFDCFTNAPRRSSLDRRSLMYVSRSVDIDELHYIGVFCVNTVYTTRDTSPCIQVNISVRRHVKAHPNNTVHYPPVYLSRRQHAPSLYQSSVWDACVRSSAGCCFFVYENLKHMTKNGLRWIQYN